MQVIAAAKGDLEQLYATGLSEDEMRRRKRVILNRLRNALTGDIEAGGGEAPEWLARPLNNARLASMSLYEGRVPELRKLLDTCGGDLRCFYARARERAQGD